MIAHGAVTFFTVALLAALATGCTPRRAHFDVAVWRLDEAGRPDAAFGTAGRAVIALTPGDDHPRGLAIPADGSVVVVGETRDSAVARPFVLRLRPDGVPDSAFGSGGVVRFGDVRGSLAVARIDGYGGVVASGHSEGDGRRHPLLAQVRADGRARPWLGGGVAARDDAHGPLLAALPGGGFVAGGSDGDEWQIARFRAGGEPDVSFGGGAVRVDWGVLNQTLASVLAAPDERILAVGDADCGIAIAAFLRDGSPDPGFGEQGRVCLGFPREYGVYVAGAALLADGRILVAADRRTVRSREPYLMRFTPEGRLDPGFGDGGMIALDRGGGLDYVYTRALAVDGQGRVVIVAQF